MIKSAPRPVKSSADRGRISAATSATGRERQGDVFRLVKEDLVDPLVKKRLEAKKRLTVEPANDSDLGRRQPAPVCRKDACQLLFVPCPASVCAHAKDLAGVFKLKTL